MHSHKLPQVGLRHMLDNIDGILTATNGVSDDQLLADYVMLRAVERAIEIISEAAKSLPLEMRQREESIPWREIIGIGNFLRHEYYRIRSDVMLDIVRHKLPALRPAVSRLLALVEDGGL